MPEPHTIKNVLLLSAYTGPEGKKAMWSGPNFGLYRLKFYLESRLPVKVDVVDPSILDVDFNKLPYDFIGFSPCHETLHHDLGLMHQAKKRSPRSALMAGGIHATFVHNWLLEKAPLDFVVLGEGELALEQALKAYDGAVGPDSVARVPGIAARGNPPKWRPALTPEQFSSVSALMDFARIPYPTHWKANAEQYKSPDPQAINTARLFTGNYCPWNCTFCSSTNFLDYAARGIFDLQKTTKVAILSTEEIFEMLLKVVRAWPDVKTVIFDDDNFVMNMVRVLAISKRIIAAKAEGRLPVDLSFICQARIDNFRSEFAKAALPVMKRAGFRMIMYGVESLSEPILAEFRKNTPVPLIDRVLRDTHAAGIQPLFYLILFSPATTMADVERTVTGALDYLDLRMEVTLNYYVLDLPGTFYDKDRGLERVFEEYPVLVDGAEAARIRQSTNLYPSDPDVRAFAQKVQRLFPEYEGFFRRKFGIRHVPGRVHTFIIFYTILDLLECGAEKARVLEMFERQYAVHV